MSEETKGFYVELPAKLHNAFKMYCDAHGVTMRHELINILSNFLRKEMFLDQDGNPASKEPTDFLDLDRDSDDVIESMEKIYEKKKRELSNVEKRREKQFNDLKKKIGGRKMDELRKLARECGLRPDPEEPDMPLLESIEPAIQNMLVRFDAEKNKFSFSKNELEKYITYLEMIRNELILKREISQIRIQKYINRGS